MNRRELILFAGQSNMMGAAALPPAHRLEIARSFEYKHKEKRFGKENGRFVKVSYQSGEFSYVDLSKAYSTHAPDVLSDLQDYRKNTYFVPAICNCKDGGDHETRPFSDFSEKAYPPGPSFPPYFAEEWEKYAHQCAYAHIAKGSTSISHYFNREMIEQVNELLRKQGVDRPQPTVDQMSEGASSYFFEKAVDFFHDAELRFKDEDTGERLLIWLQGESDATMSKEEYEAYLTVFFERLKTIGVRRFLILRVGYWGEESISEIMRAQESFCKKTPGAAILTRAISFMPFCGQDEQLFYTAEPPEMYRNCRDSFYGYMNQHLNEKAFLIASATAAKNLDRILYKKQTPLLETELVRALAGSVL